MQLQIKPGTSLQLLKFDLLTLLLDFLVCFYHCSMFSNKPQRKMKQCNLAPWCRITTVGEIILAQYLDKKSKFRMHCVCLRVLYWCCVHVWSYVCVYACNNVFACILPCCVWIWKKKKLMFCFYHRFEYRYNLRVVCSCFFQVVKLFESLKALYYYYYWLWSRSAQFNT